MKRLYVITVDNGELNGLTYELLTCEDCVFFQRHIMEGRFSFICTHPKGMVRPAPEGFCYYAAERLREEADHE